MKAQHIYSDEELVAKSKQGDQSAFKQLVIRHERLVRSTIAGMLGDVDGADDVAQEVFIRFHHSITNFKGQSKLSTYLCRIAINLSLNELKRQQRKNQRLTFLDKNERAPQIQDESAHPDKLDTKDQVRQALKQLDKEFRSVIVLRLIEGYSVKETADILNLPMGTIASRLTRGQRKLKDILDKWE